MVAGDSEQCAIAKEVSSVDRKYCETGNDCESGVEFRLEIV